MWRGGACEKFVTIATFFLLIASRLGNAAHPLILGQIVADIACDPATEPGGECPDAQAVYVMIGLYAGTKFGAELLNYLREVPFAYVAANAELHIATKVYSHIQGQSLAFHLSRETGKIIRIVSKGSQSFAQVLRFTLFNILPLLVEICFILATIAYKYP